ncbi:hypothetical protein ACHAP8_003735 [Fusarium lateritium]
MASSFIKRQVKKYSNPVIQKHEPETNFEPTIIGSNIDTFAIESLSKFNPIGSNRKPGSSLKHSQDERTPPKSSEEDASVNPQETEGNLEGDVVVDPVSLEDNVPPKQLCETVHTEPVEEQHTYLAPQLSWTPERYSQKLWDIAYDRLKDENPEVVGQYELIIIACNRATTDEKQGYALGQLSDLVRSGTDTAESPIPSRSALMQDFLERFLNRPATMTPEKLDSQSQKSDNTSGDDESLPDAIGSLGNRVKELVRGSQYATIPWVASILALEGLLRLLTIYEADETQPTVISVFCKMQWYIGISKQLFRAEDQPPVDLDAYERDKPVINLYKAILSHQLHVAICAFDETDSQSSKYKDFGLSDLAHFDEDVRIQQETLETFGTHSFKSEISDIISKAVPQKKQDKEPESDDEEGPAGDRKQLDELLQAMEVPEQPAINDKYGYFTELYQWLQETEEFRKFTSWDSELKGRILRLDGDLVMGKTELLQLVCHGLTEPQEEGISDSPQPKYVVSYFYDSHKSRQDNMLSAINSLIGQVIRAQPSLGKQLMTVYDGLGAEGWDSLTGFYTSSMVLYSILRDVEFQPTYFIIHGIDGSSGSLLSSKQSVHEWGREDFLSLIYTTVQVSDKIRWLVSFHGGHNDPSVLDARFDLRITLSYNTAAARGIIAAYAASRLADIAKIKDSQDLQAMVLRKMGTSLAFEPLWFNTALDMVKLSETYWNAPKNFEELMEATPKEEALSSLYRMALKRLDVLIESDMKYCREILSIAAIAYRPLLCIEIRELIGLPPSISLTVLVERFLSPFLKICTNEVSGEKCLNVLIRSLKRKEAASSSTEHETFNVYAALYWMRHISEVPDIDEVAYSVKLASFFMREYRVQWLEVVASHGKLRDALNMIEGMNIKLSVSTKVMPSLAFYLLYADFGNFHVQQPDTESQYYIHETIQDTGRFIKFHLLWTNDSPGNQPDSGGKMASPRDSLVFWPTMKPQWLTRAPTFEVSHRTPELCLKVLKHDDWVRACVFSPDGRLLVTGSDDQLVRVWDVETGALQHVFEALDSYAYSVVTSWSGPDGRPLLAAYGSEVIMVWDLVTGELLQPLRGIKQDTKESETKMTNKVVRFQNENSDPHDDTLEDQIMVEDGETIQGSLSKSDVSAFTVESIDISPQGNRLVALTGRNIIFWDIPSFMVTEIYEHETSAGSDSEEATDSFKKVKFSPNGGLIAASIGTSIRIQDMSNEDESYILPSRTSDLSGHSDIIDGLCFSPEVSTHDNRPMFLASCSDDGTACIWNLDTGELETMLKYHSSHVNSVSFSPDGTVLATASTDSNIGIWKKKSGSWGTGVRKYPNQVLSGHTSMIWSVAFAPDGRSLASAGTDGEVRIWEVMALHRAEQPEADEVGGGEASDSSRKGHGSPVACVSISPDGKTIASGCSDGQICFWNGETGAWHRTMEDGHVGRVNSLVFSDDGETLVSTSVDDSALVWSVNGSSGKPRLRLLGHEDWIRGAAISTDGNLAATASDDWNVLMWDISAQANLGAEHENAHAQPVAKFSGHKDYVYSVAFSPDSQQLASVGDDDRVMLWDITVLENQDIPKTVMSEGCSSIWRGVVFTVDSNFVLTVDVFGHVAIWNPGASQGNQCLGICKATTPFTTMRIDKKRPNALLTDSGIWVASHALLISEGFAVHYGYGENITKVQEEFDGGLTNFFKSVLAVEISYGFACPLSKIAVLAMYYRIFITSTLIRYSTYMLASMMASWGVAVILVSIFTCNPVEGYWDHSIPSKCIDSNKFYIGITIPNIIFDLVTVALPIREIWRLQMGRDKKWALTSIFLMGGRYVLKYRLDVHLLMSLSSSVVLASVARLVLYLIFKTSENITQTLLYGNLASSSEICLAIIAACMPPCAPLLKRILIKMTTAMSTSKSKQEGESNNTDDKNRLATLVTIGQKSSRGKNTTTVHGGSEFHGSFERLDDSGSLQGSTDGLYVNDSGETDDKSGKWSKIDVRREVAVESTVEDIPMRTLQ